MLHLMCFDEIIMAYETCIRDLKLILFGLIISYNS